MPILYPFGIVRVEWHPPVEVLALEGFLERFEVERPFPLFGHGTLLPLFDGLPHPDDDI